MPNSIWERVWTDPVLFFPKEKQNLQAQRARPTNPNLRSTNWWPHNYFLLSWGTGQICRCSCSLLLVSPRGYTYNHYESAPSEIILLDSGVLPLLSSLVSHSFSLCWHQTAGAAKRLLWLAFQDTFSAASCLRLWQRSEDNAPTLCLYLIKGCERL